MDSDSAKIIHNKAVVDATSSPKSETSGSSGKPKHKKAAQKSANTSKKAAKVKTSQTSKKEGGDFPPLPSKKVSVLTEAIEKRKSTPAKAEPEKKTEEMPHPLLYKKVIDVFRSVKLNIKDKVEFELDDPSEEMKKTPFYLNFKRKAFSFCQIDGDDTYHIVSKCMAFVISMMEGSSYHEFTVKTADNKLKTRLSLENNSVIATFAIEMAYLLGAKGEIIYSTMKFNTKSPVLEFVFKKLSRGWSSDRKKLRMTREDHATLQKLTSCEGKSLAYMGLIALIKLLNFCFFEESGEISNRLKGIITASKDNKKLRVVGKATNAEIGKIHYYYKLGFILSEKERYSIDPNFKNNAKAQTRLIAKYKKTQDAVTHQKILDSSKYLTERISNVDIWKIIYTRLKNYTAAKSADDSPFKKDPKTGNLKNISYKSFLAYMVTKRQAHIMCEPTFLLMCDGHLRTITQYYNVSKLFRLHENTLAWFVESHLLESCDEFLLMLKNKMSADTGSIAAFKRTVEYTSSPINNVRYPSHQDGYGNQPAGMLRYGGVRQNRSTEVIPPQMEMMTRDEYYALLNKKETQQDARSNIVRKGQVVLSYDKKDWELMKSQWHLTLSEITREDESNWCLFSKWRQGLISDRELEEVHPCLFDKDGQITDDLPDII